MAVDCIPHATGRSVPVHALRHHAVYKPITHVVVTASAKPRVVRHHVRLRECPPGAVVVPLADLDNENIAALYLLPYAGLERPISSESTTPAEASGMDLPVGGPSSIGGPGGGSSGIIGVPPGFGGGSAGGGNGGVGGAGGGGGGGGGGGTGPVIVPPGTTGPGGGSPTGGGVTGVPEPATWALMLIGVGAIGGLRRRERRVAISA